MTDSEGLLAQPESQSAKQPVFTRIVKSGRRTYFFDVRLTDRNEYYLSITESKKKFMHNDKTYFEKHKILIYGKDFTDFARAFHESVDFILAANPLAVKGVNDSNDSKTDDNTNI